MSHTKPALRCAVLYDMGMSVCVSADLGDCRPKIDVYTRHYIEVQ
jgi:hypothetical protein